MDLRWRLAVDCPVSRSGVAMALYVSRYVVLPLRKIHGDDERRRFR